MKKTINFHDVKFRCSSLGNLMTSPKSKTETISETTKTHLIDVYVFEKYGRQEDIQNKYITKGLAVEEDSITLYSRVKKEFYKKNNDTLSNEYIKGTPDLFEGDNIHNASLIIDIKSSWDIYTFFKVLSKDINKLYYWQMQGYMALTGAKHSKLAYCLVNTPYTLIEDEKRKLSYKMGLIDSSNNDIFDEACVEIEKSLLFDDIDISERVIEFSIERNDEDISKLYSRISECRDWLHNFDKLNEKD